MWLTGCLAPDFKTIADFRKDNGPAIRKVCREFIVVCGRAGLLAATTVAIDGSKFKAGNSRDRNFTQAKAAKRLERRSHRGPRRSRLLQRQGNSGLRASRRDGVCAQGFNLERQGGGGGMTSRTSSIRRTRMSIFALPASA